MKRRWKSIIGVSILLSLISIIIFGIPLLLFVYGIYFRDIVSLAVGILALIPAFLLYILFILAPFSVVIDNKTTIKGIKTSIEVARKKYFHLLGIFILLWVFSSIISSITYVFSVLFTFILIPPYINLVYALFYVKNKRR